MNQENGVEILNPLSTRFEWRITIWLVWSRSIKASAWKMIKVIIDLKPYPLLCSLSLCHFYSPCSPVYFTWQNFFPMQKQKAPSSCSRSSCPYWKIWPYCLMCSTNKIQPWRSSAQVFPQMRQHSQIVRLMLDLRSYPIENSSIKSMLWHSSARMQLPQMGQNSQIWKNTGFFALASSKTPIRGRRNRLCKSTNFSNTDFPAFLSFFLIIAFDTHFYHHFLETLSYTNSLNCLSLLADIQDDKAINYPRIIIWSPEHPEEKNWSRDTISLCHCIHMK